MKRESCLCGLWGLKANCSHFTDASFTMLAHGRKSLLGRRWRQVVTQFLTTRRTGFKARRCSWGPDVDTTQQLLRPHDRKWMWLLQIKEELFFNVERLSSETKSTLMRSLSLEVILQTSRRQHDPGLTAAFCRCYRLAQLAVQLVGWTGKSRYEEHRTF